MTCRDCRGVCGSGSTACAVWRRWRWHRRCERTGTACRREGWASPSATSRRHQAPGAATGAVLLLAESCMRSKLYMRYLHTALAPAPASSDCGRWGHVSTSWEQTRWRGGRAPVRLEGPVRHRRPMEAGVGAQRPRVVDRQARARGAPHLCACLPALLITYGGTIYGLPHRVLACHVICCSRSPTASACRRRWSTASSRSSATTATSSGEEEEESRSTVSHAHTRES